MTEPDWETIIEEQIDKWQDTLDWLYEQGD